MDYLLSSLLGYFLGSFPSAYILLKKTKKIDITAEGTGNVGAMNAFDVTRSKLLGGLVLLIDLLKGIVSVYLALLFFRADFIFPALALLFAVFSHCFNPWLKLKGGRGLATAAGGTILLFPVIPAVWILVWIISFLIKRDIIFSNVWAVIMTIIIIFGSADIVNKYSFPKADTAASLLLFSAGLMLVIFSKHIEPLQELINNKNFFVKRK